MRKEFQLCLDWLLQFKIMDRILSGGFGVTFEREKPSEEEQARTLERLRLEKESREARKAELKKKAEEHVCGLDEDSDCLEVRRRFIQVNGAECYLNTLAKASLLTEVVNCGNNSTKELVVSSKSASKDGFYLLTQRYLNNLFITRGYAFIREVFKNVGELKYAWDKA
jgi:hypothetical protein